MPPAAWVRCGKRSTAGWAACGGEGAQAGVLPGPEFLERFRNEARTTAMLNHPGIASVHDYGETTLNGEGRTAYLVMELVNGEPLNSVLKRTGKLSLRHALDMLEQTGRALQVAHAAGWCTATSNRAIS
ncbi:tyrosine kinase family protein [Mycobacterium xenopi 3993]|nr:tyrosine kinase family protein [Mycobacterium xenopi 3993]